MKKRGAAILLAVLTVIMTLSACGSKTVKQTYNVLQDSKYDSVFEVDSPDIDWGEHVWKFL